MSFPNLESNAGRMLISNNPEMTLLDLQNLETNGDDLEIQDNVALEVKQTIILVLFFFFIITFRKGRALFEKVGDIETLLGVVSLTAEGAFSDMPSGRDGLGVSIDDDSSPP